MYQNVEIKMSPNIDDPENSPIHAYVKDWRDTKIDQSKFHIMLDERRNP